MAFGLVRVGTAAFALPAAHIVEAVAAPSAYDIVPGQPGAMKGYFVLRGEAIATLDTQSILFPGVPATTAARQVVVLRFADATFGIEVDAVGNTESVDADRVLELGGASDKLDGIFCQLLAMGEPRTLLGIADIASLYAATGGMAARAQSRITRDVREQTCSTKPGRGESGNPAQHAIVRCGSHLVCLDAASIVAVEQMPQLQGPALKDAAFLGVAKWDGGDLAVMNLAAVLGLPGHETAADGDYMLVFNSGTVLSGFAVDALAQLRLLTRDDILPVPKGAFRDPALLAGAVSDENGDTALVVDSRALSESKHLVHLPGPVNEGGSRRTRASGPKRSKASFVVFAVGGELVAADSSHVVEIVFRPRIALRSSSAPESLGLIDWRGELIELVDLSAVARRRAGAVEPAQALVVASDGSTLAFAIDRVITMSGPNDITEVTRMANHETGRTSSILAIGERPRVSYEVIDLVQIAQERLASSVGV